MSNLLRRLVFGAVILQTILLAVTAAIFLILLPAKGIHALAQINSVDAFTPVAGELYAISWVHFLFSLAIGVVSVGLFRQIKQRAPLLIRFLTAAALLWVCVFFIGHDLGFGLILWPEIAADPASTNFDHDLVLLNVRNVIFFLIGVLTVLDAHRERVHFPALGGAF